MTDAEDILAARLREHVGEQVTIYVGQTEYSGTLREAAGGVLKLANDYESTLIPVRAVLAVRWVSG